MTKVKPVPEPWERQDWETAAAWRAFQRFIAQERPRNITAAYREDQAKRGKDTAHITAPSGQWKVWAAGTHRGGQGLSWKERERLYDQHMAALLQERKEAALVVYETEIMDMILGRDGRGVLTILRDMLDWPLEIQEREEGGEIVIVSPARWTVGDVAKLMAAADRIMRLVAAVPTDRTEHSASSSSVEALAKLPEEILNERIAQLLRGVGLAQLAQGGEGAPTNPLTSAPISEGPGGQDADQDPPG